MGVSRENIIHPCSKFISWQNKFLKGISMVLDVHKMSSTLQIKWHTLVLQLLIMEHKELGNFNVYFIILLDLHDKHKIQRWGEKTKCTNTDTWTHTDEQWSGQITQKRQCLLSEVAKRHASTNTQTSAKVHSFLQYLGPWSLELNLGQVEFQLSIKQVYLKALAPFIKHKNQVVTSLSWVVCQQFVRSSALSPYSSSLVFWKRKRVWNAIN